MGGPLQGRDEVVRGVAGGLDGPEGEDGMAEWHGPMLKGWTLESSEGRPR